ncbi:MAG: hypothetical protein CMF59_13780 [Leptospiraceae bacterium]|nr:hypothetical protein [Leptospiraceae bacterium]
MKILGLDPGFGITGWGFVSFHGSSLNQPTLHSYGAMTTPMGQPLSWRLADLQNQMEALLDRLQPDRVAMERLFFGKNITTAEGVYQARGVLLAAMGQRSIVPIELTPNQIKQSITGSGKARKPEMMRMVQMLLNIDEPIRSDDAADALGCAIAASAYSHLEYQQLQHREMADPKIDVAEESEEELELPGERYQWPGPSVPLDSEVHTTKNSRRRTDPVTGTIGSNSPADLDLEGFTEQIALGSEIRLLRSSTSQKKSKPGSKKPASRKKSSSQGKSSDSSNKSSAKPEAGPSAGTAALKKSGPSVKKGSEGRAKRKHLS